MKNLINTKYDYNKLFEDVVNNRISREEKLKHYKYLAKNDLYFLLRYVFNREDMEHQWLYDRCQDVQQNNDGTIDLWARAHYKSTIITFGLTIQQLLQNPDFTICIFSHTNAIAKSFLRSIKNAFKTNNMLRTLFPDIIPEPNDTSRLSEDKIRLLTNTTRKENSVDASGLVDGQHTGMHYDIRVYDDIVVPESVSTPDQMKKLKDMFELSHNLASRVDISRIIGTRYHYSDLFEDLREQGGWKFREYPAEVNGAPVLLSPKELHKKKTQMGSYIYACQMLLKPAKSDDAIFANVRLNTFSDIPKLKNVVILVDPAIAKAGCYSVIMAVGITEDHKIYLLDYISKVGMKPQEAAEAIHILSHKFNTRNIAIEQVGYQQALKYITEDYFRDRGEYINVDELKPHKSKDDRIIALLPYFENNQIYIRNNMKEFENEVTMYPFYKYRDHIDVFAYSLQYFKPLKVDYSGITGNIKREIDEGKLNKYTRSMRWQRERKIMEKRTRR